MFTRTFQLLAVLFCVVAMVGCEGEQGETGLTGPVGPDGPEGPEGPSVILCMGEINGIVSPPAVVSSWPSDVTVTVELLDMTETGASITAAIALQTAVEALILTEYKHSIAVGGGWNPIKIRGTDTVSGKFVNIVGQYKIG